MGEIGIRVIRGDARAIELEMLIIGLKDMDNGSVRRQRAAERLGEIKDTRAVEPLIAVLKDEDEFVRHWAAWALGKIRNASNV